MHAIGVDIGGTKIAAGVVDDDGRIIAKTLRSTVADDSVSIEAAVIDAVAELRHVADVQAIGVAAAGFVSEDRAVVRFAPNIAWRDHPLRDRLAERIDIPIVVENDANAAGWAEFRFGAGRDADHMVMLTVGTGLGGAVICNGALLRGGWGLAAEVGHMRVVPGGQFCGCGHEGCWEQYASGSALVRWGKEAVITQPDRAVELLRRVDGDVERLTGPVITASAEDGDPLAVELLASLGEWLGEGMASIAALLDPQAFVIGGGVSAAGSLLLQPAIDGFERALPARGHRHEARICIAALGNDAGIVGAADLARI